MLGHWIERYIGMEYRIDYNCFDHFVHVQKEQFNLDVLKDVPKIPAFDEKHEAIAFIRGTKELKSWREVNMIKEGDAVIFGVDGMSFHIGNYIESNNVKGIMHNSEKHGVILTSLQVIRNSLIKPSFLRYYRG